MMNDTNALYNLMNQLTQEQKSLWRIDNHYLVEAMSEEERIFWRNLKIEKENAVKELRSLIKQLLG